jgi:predicted RNA-binding Zn-ribbon protein involved in translation (DUF1610 family)
MILTRRTIKSISTTKKTRAFRCPVCGKRELFILLIGEEAGKLKQCKNCGYTHKEVEID